MEWINGNHTDLADTTWKPIIYDSDTIFGDTLNIQPQLNGHIQPASITNMYPNYRRVKVTSVKEGIKYLGNKWSPAPHLLNTTEMITADISQDAMALKQFTLE